MSPGASQPYRVSLSGRVFDKVRELAAVATARGDGEAFLAALREFDRRLRVYPQFGDPLIDLRACYELQVARSETLCSIRKSAASQCHPAKVSLKRS